MNVWGVTFGGCLAKILSFKLGNLLDSAIGRAAVYHTEGCRFDPGSGHSKFLFLQREFTSALGLKLPG